MRPKLGTRAPTASQAQCPGLFADAPPDTVDNIVDLDKGHGRLTEREKLARMQHGEAF